MRDDTTRFPCGAAHRDEEFADSTVREYLAEAAGPNPRSRGAVSRAPVPLFAASAMPLARWLPVAATGVRPAGGRTGPGSSPHVRRPLGLGSVAGAMALTFVLFEFTEGLGAASTSSRRSCEGYERESSGAGPAAVIIALVPHAAIRRSAHE
ncbi:hypothetical protein [Lentzea sp.]|uniref:hypothetical protein n=1 Tax=Lentzea sp. TaxID=56099 RepID=UPI002BBBE692|nr:hypothetical protein [Lentzea sp.]HUQ54513.1 hypothetical protein [Lentzea sp.]